jgi:hypothetical protein
MSAIPDSELAAGVGQPLQETKSRDINNAPSNNAPGLAIPGDAHDNGTDNTIIHR